MVRSLSQARQLDVDLNDGHIVCHEGLAVPGEPLSIEHSRRALKVLGRGAVGVVPVSGDQVGRLVKNLRTRWRKLAVVLRDVQVIQMRLSS